MRMDEEAFYIDDDVLHWDICNTRKFAVYICMTINVFSTRNAAK